MSTQRVDPFIPVQSPRPYPGLVNNIPRRPAQNPRHMDVTRPVRNTSLTPAKSPIAPPMHKQSAIPPQSPPRKVMSMPPPAPTLKPFGRQQPSQPTQAENTSHAKKTKPKRRLLRALRTPALGLLIMLGGVFVQTAVFGEAAIGVYALVVLWRRIPSRTTFLMALLSLIGVVTLLLVKTNDGLAATFTIYTFLLLVVGVLCLLREMRAENA